MGDFLAGIRNNFLFKNKAELFVALAAVFIIFMMLIPLPDFLLDILLSINLLFSLIIILIVLYSSNSVEFSVFPTLLLISTVFDLALNISTTRLILLQGPDFSGAIIRSFGNFVVGSKGMEGVVIGIIIFTIILAVQFIVITRGSTRIAEVAARFTLDSLPGKQMSIDAAYSSGTINEEQAQQQKQALQAEVSFYGAMDGASKFVSGNVKVGIFITLVNIVAGMILGISIHHMSASEAFDTYTRLTIGDGLVSQIPALLVSVATGLMVTRAISKDTFAKDMSKQFTQQASVYWIGAVFLLVLAFIPGFPFYILIPMALLLGFVAWRIGQTSKKKASNLSQQKDGQAEEAIKPSVDIEPIVPLDPLSLELGYGLIPLVDQKSGSDFLNRITKLRREVALELGLVVPKIHIIDNMRLEVTEYCFKIKGIEVGKGQLKVNQFLAINPGYVEQSIPGEPTVDPTFGLPALWIQTEDKQAAQQAGYTVVDPPSIIVTHLTELIKNHAAELLGKQEVQLILDTLKDKYSVVVQEVGQYFSVGEIQRVLQGLLREHVSIRNIVSILEALSEYVNVTKDVYFLIERVRQALSRQICLQYADENKILHCIALDPELEHLLIQSKVETAQGLMAVVEPEVQKKWVLYASQTFERVQSMGYMPIILCSEAARILVKNNLMKDYPDLVVLSMSEMVSNIKIEIIAEISFQEKT